ncbi:hypothetical protein FHG87_008452 [Trinorchestia longiramus]|nr:hypothetical protein FHG87_008452 [Trinorchestia longiramus]
MSEKTEKVSIATRLVSVTNANTTSTNERSRSGSKAQATAYIKRPKRSVPNNFGRSSSTRKAVPLNKYTLHQTQRHLLPFPEEQRTPIQNTLIKHLLRCRRPRQQIR